MQLAIISSQILSFSNLYGKNPSLVSSLTLGAHPALFNFGNSPSSAEKSVIYLLHQVYDPCTALIKSPWCLLTFESLNLIELKKWNVSLVFRNILFSYYEISGNQSNLVTGMGSSTEFSNSPFLVKLLASSSSVIVLYYSCFLRIS